MTPPVILVVDDDAPSARLVTSVARPLGIGTVVARDGEEALALPTLEVCPLGLFDLHLPGRQGLALLRALRESGRAPQRCILMTADISASRADFVGPDRFDLLWHKPIPVPELIAELRALTAPVAVP